MSADPRVEAAARVVNASRGKPLSSASAYVNRDKATRVLAAADRADREQGIHRVTINDDTVEKVARTLHTRWFPEMQDAPEWDCLTDGQRDAYYLDARAVLAALTEVES